METQECTQIGENGLLEPFWVIRVHCCDARVASGGTSAPAAMACRQRPLGGPPLPWPGKQALRERRRQVGVFAEAATHTNPRRAVKYVDFATVWGQGHTMPERTGSGTANFIEWVRECCV